MRSDILLTLFVLMLASKFRSHLRQLMEIIALLSSVFIMTNEDTKIGTYESYGSSELAVFIFFSILLWVSDITRMRSQNSSLSLRNTIVMIMGASLIIHSLIFFKDSLSWQNLAARLTKDTIAPFTMLLFAINILPSSIDK